MTFFRASCLVMLASLAGTTHADEIVTNSLGMELVRVPAGEFAMGVPHDLKLRDWFDSRPLHQVKITRAFSFGRREVTIDQFRQFDPAYQGDPKFAPFATGITWDRAVAFARWLSAKEGRPYRLPTEAEWEYVAKAAHAESGAKAVENLGAGPVEWCLDWFGPYRPGAAVDPVGYTTGRMKVVRGGRMGSNPNRDWSHWEIDYSRPEARLAFPPGFGPYEKNPQSLGFHPVGIRLVQAEEPRGTVFTPMPPLHEIGVRQDVSTAKIGPDPAIPYFRTRRYLPSPPDDVEFSAIDAAGFEGRFRPHHHSPGVTVMPNGDVLVAMYTSYEEYEAGVSIIAARLRHGADQWDLPSLLVDTVGVNDHAPLLMRDGDTVRLFWGSPFVGGVEVGPAAFPFQWMSSTDNGSTWGAVRYPLLEGQLHGYTRQPINSAFRDAKGRLLVASDGGRDPRSGLGGGPESFLWASDNGGESWYDTGGRTFGRHTTFVEAKDGRILGFGGKNTEIEGFMPLATSVDGARSFSKSKSAFPALGNNQRPAVLRLQSGRILFAGDYARRTDGAKPIPGTKGSYVALSDDDGVSWRFKTLPGTGDFQVPDVARLMGGGTLGYAAAAQAPDGVIHLITTMTKPSVHLAFNEAWILAPDAAGSDEAAMVGTVRSVRDVRLHEERYPDGRRRGTWSGGIANDGQLALQGPQSWYYPDGTRQWEVAYTLGRKSGLERFYGPGGNLESEFRHGDDESFVWTQFWPNGARRSQSHWKKGEAHGPATRWDPQGHVTSMTIFEGGQATNYER
jgi:formylglycine-generating enzyme required for sulfatase activity